MELGWGLGAVRMMYSANMEYDAHGGWPRQLHTFIIEHLELTIGMPMVFIMCPFISWI